MPTESSRSEVYLSQAAAEMNSSLAQRWKIPAEDVPAYAVEEFLKSLHLPPPIKIADPVIEAALKDARSCIYESEHIYRLVTCYGQRTNGSRAVERELGAPPETFLAHLRDSVVAGNNSIAPAVERLLPHAERVMVSVPPNPGDICPRRSITEVTAHETVLRLAEYLLSQVWGSTDPTGFADARAEYLGRAERWSRFNPVLSAQRVPKACKSLAPFLPVLDLEELLAACQREAVRADRGRPIGALEPTPVADAQTPGWRVEGCRASYGGGTWFPLRGRKYTLLEMLVAEGKKGVTAEAIATYAGGTPLTDSAVYKFVSELNNAIRVGLGLEKDVKTIARIGPGRWALALNDLPASITRS